MKLTVGELIDILLYMDPNLPVMVGKEDSHNYRAAQLVRSIHYTHEGAVTGAVYILTEAAT